MGGGGGINVSLLAVGVTKKLLLALFNTIDASSVLADLSLMAMSRNLGRAGMAGTVMVGGGGGSDPEGSSQSNTTVLLLPIAIL